MWKVKWKTCAIFFGESTNTWEATCSWFAAPEKRIQTIGIKKEFKQTIGILRSNKKKKLQNLSD